MVWKQKEPRVKQNWTGSEMCRSGGCNMSRICHNTLDTCILSTKRGVCVAISEVYRLKGCMISIKLVAFTNMRRNQIFVRNSKLTQLFSNGFKPSQIARFTWPTWGPPGSCRPSWAPCRPHEHCYQGSVLKDNHSMRTRSKPRIHLASPGHQQPRHWQNKSKEKCQFFTFDSYNITLPDCLVL